MRSSVYVRTGGRVRGLRGGSEGFGCGPGRLKSRKDACPGNLQQKETFHVYTWGGNLAARTSETTKQRISKFELRWVGKDWPRRKARSKPKKTY